VKTLPPARYSLRAEGTWQTPTTRVLFSQPVMYAAVALEVPRVRGAALSIGNGVEIAVACGAVEKLLRIVGFQFLLSTAGLEVTRGDTPSKRKLTGSPRWHRPVNEKRRDAGEMQGPSVTLKNIL
jgi:hypothetical protein